MSENEIDGTTTVPGAAAAGDRDIVTDPDVVKDDDVTTATVGDADVHDPPMRSATPDAPVAAGVGIGQGAHTPPDPAAFDAQGRPLAEASTVAADAGGELAAPERPTDDAVTDTVGSDAAPAEGEHTTDGDGDGDGDEPNPVPDDVSEADADELVEAHTGAELEAAAEARGVATSGTKPELAARLIEHDRD